MERQEKKVMLQTTDEKAGDVMKTKMRGMRKRNLVREESGRARMRVDAKDCNAAEGT